MTGSIKPFRLGTLFVHKWRIVCVCVTSSRRFLINYRTLKAGKKKDWDRQIVTDKQEGKFSNVKKIKPVGRVVNRKEGKPGVFIHQDEQKIKQRDTVDRQTDRQTGLIIILVLNSLRLLSLI